MREDLSVFPLIGDKSYVNAFMQDFPECTFEHWVYPRTTCWRDVADQYPGVTFIGLETASPSGIVPSPEIARQIIFNQRDGIIFNGKLFDIGDTGSFLYNCVYYDINTYLIRGVAFECDTREPTTLCVLSCEDSAYKAEDGAYITERTAYDRLPECDRHKLDQIYQSEYEKL